jgi:WhiB family redox-sensing transcriptional regulator
MYALGWNYTEIGRILGGFAGNTVKRWLNPVKPLPPAPVELGERWRDGALCAETDPELWHTENGRGAAKAIDICRRCPCIEPCLQHALDHHETGIWGGTTESKRQKLRRKSACPP